MDSPKIKRFSSLGATAGTLGALGAGIGYTFGRKPGAIAGGILGGIGGTGLYVADKWKKNKQRKEDADYKVRRDAELEKYRKTMNTWKMKNPGVYKELSGIKETDDIYPIIEPHQLQDLGTDYLPPHIIPLILKNPVYDGGDFLVYDTKAKKYGWMICGGDPDFNNPKLNIKTFMQRTK